MTGAALLSIGIFISSVTESQAMAAGICFAAMLLNYYMVTLAEYVASSAYGSLVAILILELIIALLIKNMTGNPLLSKIFGGLSMAAAVALYVYKSEWFEGLFPKILENISVYERFYEFVDGIFDYTHVVYFISVIVFFLLEHMGRAVSREEINKILPQRKREGGRNVDTHIKNLRRRLDLNDVILSVRSVGYRIDEERFYQKMTEKQE